MRISDWSSDVCSSDLLQAGEGPGPGVEPDARGVAGDQVAAAGATGTRVGAVAPEDRQPEVVAGGDRRGDRAGCGPGQTSVGCARHPPRCMGAAASPQPVGPACEACTTQPQSLPSTPPPRSPGHE